jgi:hypothetical protein
MPIPSLSISWLLRSGLVEPKPPLRGGETGVGDTTAGVVDEDAVFDALAAASAASASGS